MEEKDREKELDDLKINLDILSLEPGKVVEIAKGSDFSLFAEKLAMAGGMAIYLEYQGKREIVDYRDSEELEEIEEELREMIARGERPQMHNHKHKRPRCRKMGTPYACGHRSCGYGAMHVMCWNAPFTKKYLCSCIGP